MREPRDIPYDTYQTRSQAEYELLIDNKSFMLRNGIRKCLGVETDPRYDGIAAVRGGVSPPPQGGLPLTPRQPYAQQLNEAPDAEHSEATGA